MPKKTRDVIVASSDWTVPSADGMHRRTIVKGAAWTVPVVAVAMATPAAAASKTPTIAFTNGPYTVNACKTLKDVTVKATTDGTTPVAAGTLISVTLPEGLAWSDGTTGTKSFPADGTGQVALSGIHSTTNYNETVTMSAAQGSAKTTAPVKIENATVAVAFRGGSAISPDNSYQSVPAGSTSIGDGVYLAPNGDLYNGNTVVATGVKSANFVYADNNTYRLSWTTATGSFRQGTGLAKEEFTKVPDGATAVGDGFYLTSDGDLYQGDTLYKSGVTSAHFDYAEDNNYRISYVTDKGAFRQGTGLAEQKYTNVPTGSTAIGDGVFLAANGDLYSNDSVIDTGVKSAVFNYSDDNVYRLNWTTDKGAFRQGTNLAKESYKNVPGGSTAVGDGTFLATNGDLYVSDKVYKSNVTSAEFTYIEGGGYRLTYVTKKPACA